MSHNPLAIPQFQMLTREQCEVIHRASLEILRRTGVRVYHDGALALLRETDAVMTDENLVHLPAGLVEWALKQAPSRVALYKRALVFDVCSVLWYTEFNAPTGIRLSGDISCDTIFASDNPRIKEVQAMQVEDYFDFIAPDDIRIKGSRIGIESVLYEYIHREQSPEAIEARFPTLTLEQVYATILYYIQNRERVEAYITDWLEYGRRMRAEQDRNPPPVVVRLRALKAEGQRALAIG